MTSHYNWTETAIDSARTKSIPWVIVGMHKPCLSLGEYACEPGTDIFNLLLDKKVDLVLTGHEHLYQRTHQLAKSAGCASIVPGTSAVSGCIADNDSNFAKGSGTIFATVGTGGINLRDVSASDPEAGYFAASSGLNSNATWGSLNVVATSTTLNANFSRASGGTFTDSFRIDPPVAQPNVPPVARITKSCQGLTCTIDGRTSSDSDGSIVSYAWQLGDGATDSRDNFSHTYGSPGTYPISLTVTDDDGATHLVNDVVTVANPTNQPPTAVASVSCAALTCTANGGGSTDPDGTIVGYAWNFGDGSTGTGATAPHTYASAGTYSVTLTVTDNAGGTGTSTASAQPTSPPTSLASDAFARTLASGWGSADVGGSWSTVGSSYSVADGVGRISVAAGSGRSAVLSQVSSNNTDLSFSLVSNKAITGSGLYVAAIGRSISNAGDYRAKARLMSNGTIGLSLTRNNAAGTETIILAESTVAGLQFAAGDRLYVRVQVSGVSPTTVRAKMWKQGQTEPVTWARSVTDTTAALQGAGTVGLYYYLSSGATNGPVTLSLDDFLANSP